MREGITAAGRLRVWQVPGTVCQCLTPRELSRAQTRGQAKLLREKSNLITDNGVQAFTRLISGAVGGGQVGGLGVPSIYDARDAVNNPKCNLRNSFVGAAGNVAITTTSGAISVSGMAGGTTVDRAAGFVEITGSNPAATETVTISDGTNTETFEFLNTGGTPAGSNIAVEIGLNNGRTMDNLIEAIKLSSLTMTVKLAPLGVAFNEIVVVRMELGDPPDPATAPAGGDTALQQFRYDAQNFVASYPAVDQVTFGGLVPIADEDGTVFTEEGIFLGNDVLFARTTFNGVTKPVGQALQFEHTITVQRA